MVQPELRSPIRAGRGGRVDAPGKGRPEIWPGGWHGADCGRALLIEPVTALFSRGTAR
jgi:hypothetical protein